MCLWLLFIMVHDMVSDKLFMLGFVVQAIKLAPLISFK